jgi:hypothetical protein
LIVDVVFSLEPYLLNIHLANIEFQFAFHVEPSVEKVLNGTGEKTVLLGTKKGSSKGSPIGTAGEPI